MTIPIDKFLVSTGSPDEEYGLYVMEKVSSHHSQDSFLAYNYDSDYFSHLNARDKDLFIPVEDVPSCNDEFGNEYRGEKLIARIRDAIKAYTEELPGYVLLMQNADFHED